VTPESTLEQASNFMLPVSIRTDPQQVESLQGRAIGLTEQFPLAGSV
jgi:hypothetical protein